MSMEYKVLGIVVRADPSEPGQVEQVTVLFPEETTLYDSTALTAAQERERAMREALKKARELVVHHGEHPVEDDHCPCAMTGECGRIAGGCQYCEFLAFADAAIAPKGE